MMEFSGSDDVVVASNADMLDAISIASSRSSLEFRFERLWVGDSELTGVDEVKVNAGGDAICDGDLACGGDGSPGAPNVVT